MDFSVNMKIEKFDCHKFSEAILFKSFLFAYVMNGIIEFGISIEHHECLKAYKFPNGNSSKLDLFTVDVVPYITNLTNFILL